MQSRILHHLAPEHNITLDSSVECNLIIWQISTQHYCIDIVLFNHVWMQLILLELS